MFELKVNGKIVTATEDKELIDFLREDLKIKSVKAGCYEGVCGTCTVIIGGKAVRTCVMKLSKVVDKGEIITIEGISQREKDVYAYTFAKCGAVQCGFCIPGMIMSAKVLIDVNNNPTREDIKKAIRTNICRCTGYVKIEEAIMLAAKMIRENIEIPKENSTGKVGEDIARLDAVEKTLGTGLYVDDVDVDGMIYGKALRSNYPRAKVISIDVSEAKKHPDCEIVLTADDIPGSNKVGHLVKDWDTMIAVGDTTRYIGDALALVASKNMKTLDDILDLIKVEYEVLTPMSNPEEAMADGAPLIHANGNILKEERIVRGNPDEAIKNSKYVVEESYSVPFTDHAFMEPECAIAMIDPETDGILLYTGSQSVYDEQREIAGMLGMELDKIRCKSMLVGGGFGGKEDMSVQHHAALIAYHTKKPVKVRFSRQESLNIHTKRHAMEMKFTTACDENGKLTAMKAYIVSDTGAYASLGGPVLQRACTHAAGPYNYQNSEIIGKVVYTNNPPGGAFRGFGVSQSAFATEQNLNKLAEMVGISPWEIRFRNAIKPGEELPNGQIANETTGLVECLLSVKEDFEKAKYAGIASSFKNSGLGVGVPDRGRCLVSIENGKAHVRCSAACIGQGMATVELQMFCEATGISPYDVVVEGPDTARTPNSGTTTASRQTLFSGEAVAKAGKMVKEKLDEGKSLADLEGEEFYAEYFGETDPLGSDKPNPVSHIAYGYAAQVVILNDEGKLDKVVAAYDVGQIVNPKSCEGQIEGGIAMGLGYGLSEDFPLENGIPKVKYGTLGLFRSTDMPEIEVRIIDREYKSDLAYGSKGVGELATIPTAPAVAAAYYSFDGEFRSKLPISNNPYNKRKK